MELHRDEDLLNYVSYVADNKDLRGNGNGVTIKSAV